VDQVEETKARKKTRWKRLLSVEVVLLVMWAVLRLIPAIKESGSAGAVNLVFLVLMGGYLLGWLILLSGLPWRMRFAGAAVALLLPGMVKMDGHTGSFFPQFSWRWTASSATELPEFTGKMAEEGTVFETKGAANFPRLLGESMNNKVSGEMLPDGWFERKPSEIWRRSIGEGWSAFSVSSGYAFTMEQLGPHETTICYELKTGEPVWAHQEKVRFEESMGDDGPRSTPTIADGRVFSLGATGILSCLDARTGELIWGMDVLSEAGHDVPKWAKSCSPLVVDDKVLVTLGEKAEKNLAAINVRNGKLIWRSGDYPSSYASPVVAELAGKRQIVALQQKSVDGYDIETGEILWSFPIRNGQSNCASPMIIDDTVITSGGYGYGTHRIQISKTDEGFEAKQMWKSLKLKAKFADFLVHQGHIYGLNEGRLVCLDLETGRSTWRGTNLGHGQLLGVGDHAIVQHEDGPISVIALNPEKETIVNEFDALEHRTWNHPVVAGNMLLVRNDRDAIAFEWE
jgi:outer membrane protein assembly factor BamB